MATRKKSLPVKPAEPVEEQPTEPPQVTVRFEPTEWTVVAQLMSAGIRSSDDSVLEIGGNLLNRLKRQVADGSH